MDLQRAHGEVVLALRRRGDQTALADLRQEGCLKVRFPRADGLHAVLLNTSGGVAGGDRLRTRIALQAGASASIATQAAERFYRARADDAVATAHTHIRLDDAADLHWLPQEAILFDGCNMDRRLDIDMADEARFLGVEAMVFGRAAMGETLRRARIADTIAIRRGGRRVLHDAVRLSGDVAAQLERPAMGDGAAAVATILHVAPDAAAGLPGLRSALAEAPVHSGASAWDGMLMARLLARDAAALRAGLVAGLACLRGQRTLPRVWLC